MEVLKMGAFSFLEVIPYTAIAVLIVLSVFFIYYYSRKNDLDFRKELLKYFKGVALLLILCPAVFLSAIILKYMSFLKIDILQPGVLSTTIFSAAAIILLFEYSLKTFENISDKLDKIPYIIKQILLLSIVSCVLFAVTVDVELWKIAVASTVPCIIYHLVYVRVHEQMIKFVRYLSSRYDRIYEV